MKRKLLGLGMGLLCASMVLTGCELLHHEQREKPVETIPDPEAPASVEGVQSKPTEGFFQPSRLSGAWSSEARSIEKNLGVP